MTDVREIEIRKRSLYVKTEGEKFFPKLYFQFFKGLFFRSPESIYTYI